jgi:arabinose-5-phosphate isomerase
MRENCESDQILNWAKEAILAESEAITRAASILDHDFVEATRCILALQGKVIMTGLGKSGHVARKIAATLASTGTSSFYLHPTEALHGDFGMIGPQDMVLAIAFSGETREVLEVLKFARRRGIKCAAICGRRDSSLAQLVDFFLDGSVSQEACPLNLAPTSSTAVAMALGDALAIALMRSRGFKEIDFATYHPEGTLGKRLSLVADHMRDCGELAQIHYQDDFYKVLEKVTQNNFGIAAVVSDEGYLAGAITDGDLRRAIIKHKDQVFMLSAVEMMTKNPRTIQREALAIDAFNMMERNKITAVFVIDAGSDKRLLGIIRMHDLLAAKII